MKTIPGPRFLVAAAITLATAGASRAARADDVNQPPIAPPAVQTVNGTTYVILSPGPAAPPPKRKYQRNDLAMAFVGGTITFMGAMTFGVGVIGYFATVDCHTESGWLPTVHCSDEPGWLYAAAGGAVVAGALGAPLLAVGLKKVPLRPEPATEPPTTAELVFGPASASLRVQF